MKYWLLNLSVLDGCIVKGLCLTNPEFSKFMSLFNSLIYCSTYSTVKTMQGKVNKYFFLQYRTVETDATVMKLSLCSITYGRSASG